MIALLSPHSPREVAGTILVLQVRNSNPSYSEPSCEVLKTLSFGYSEAQVLFVLTPCFISLIFCRARVLFPQGPSLPTCRVQPLCASFLHELRVCFVSGLGPSSRQDYCPEAFGSVWRGFRVFTSPATPASPGFVCCAQNGGERRKAKWDWGRGGCHLQTKFWKPLCLQLAREGQG